MPNLTKEELQETRSEHLPPATLTALEEMRTENCALNKDFKLQNNQRFLRRVMSPDSPTRSILLVHGTGVGKTCTAIQIAEEYIIRPEFQDKRVFVVANPAIQENFKSQIFDVSKITVDEGVVLSKQCTGKRYLDMLQRAQSEPLRLTDRHSQQRITAIVSKIVREFYEFSGYEELANTINREEEQRSTEDFERWIKDTFNDRLIIVDEAHNLRETSETGVSKKRRGIAIEKILSIAKGITFVLLTATPMYDTYDELIYYFNLFLLNDGVINSPAEFKKNSDIFKSSGEFKEGKEQEFRSWCQDYISYVRGENPFTFPFRLPPPQKYVIIQKKDKDIAGNEIKEGLKYLKLTGSLMSEYQSEIVKKTKGISAEVNSDTICCFPDNKPFKDSFKAVKSKYKYTGEKFLAPSQISKYSSKFALMMKIIKDSTGIVFVFSNLVQSGVQLFAMCLEEHGFYPAIGDDLLAETSGEVPKRSAGKYVLITSDISNSDIRKVLMRLKDPKNADGSDIRIILASPKAAEGVDFRFVRQIHVIEPWFNMSRIEQVLGRGMRTCSHALLPFQDQNCTVYLHACEHPTPEYETVDETIYRTIVEKKAIEIAKVKRIVMESAMDCELQEGINTLPQDWRVELNIPQRRNEDGEVLQLTMQEMSAPTFEEVEGTLKCNNTENQPVENYERPLSTILDVREEVEEKLIKLLIRKPIWLKEELFGDKTLKSYSKNVVSYILQNAIDTGLKFKDGYGRVGQIQSRGNMIAFGIGPRDTMLSRILKDDKGTPSKITVVDEVVENRVEVEEIDLTPKLDALPEYIKTGFSEDVRRWYVIDHLPETEKVKYILSFADKNPLPKFAETLFEPVSDGSRIAILGYEKVYHNNEKVVPVGIVKDAYDSWLRKSMSRYIDNIKGKLYATLKGDAFIFNADKEDGSKPSKSLKTLGGMSCTSFKGPVLESFIKLLGKEAFPKGVTNKEKKCDYLEYVVKDAVLKKVDGINWILPEEYDVLNTNNDESLRR